MHKVHDEWYGYYLITFQQHSVAYKAVLSDSDIQCAKMYRSFTTCINTLDVKLSTNGLVMWSILAREWQFTDVTGNPSF